MSNYIRMMLESTRRCAGACQDAANDARNAAAEASTQAGEIDEMATEAANRAVAANERVKVLEAKLTAANTEPPES